VSKKPKPWKRAVELVEKCRSGKVICCSHPPDGGEVSYFLEPGGFPIGEKTVKNALEHGLITPQNDGLFGAETSQTWVPAS